MSKKAPLLIVDWEDHHANGAWSDEIDHTPAQCRSVGWLAKEDTKAITLAGNVSLDDRKSQVGNTQYILKTCIIRKRTVR